MSYVYNLNPEEPLQSKFNSATFKIYRLNECWSNVNKFWRKADFSGLNWELDIIWAELSCDSVKKDKDKIEEVNKKIQNARNKKEFIKNVIDKWHSLFYVEKAQGLGKSYYNPDSDSALV